MRLRTTVVTLTASIWLGSAQLALHLLAQAPSLQANLLADWSNQKDRLMKLASVMPAEQFGFKPTAAQRNYGEQILHIAEANVMRLNGITPPASQRP